MDRKQKIIFFDSYCGLCDRFITEIFIKDKNHVFQFAPLQGLTASQLKLSSVAVDSVIYWKEEVIYVKSQAVLEILQDLGGFYSLFSLFKIVPRYLRDATYDFIAKRRYGWFGEASTCRLPNPSEKAYFLD